MHEQVSIDRTRVSVRFATVADVPAMEALIVASARDLSRGFYTPEEAEAAITHMFGVDTNLVADGSYLIAETDDRMLGCGGWSARRTLFGGDRYAVRDDARLDPAVDPARIRAFFVAPHAARQGVGTAILDACETAAANAGFTRTSLMATLPGVPFYVRHGYVAGPVASVDCGGTLVTFIPMTKSLLQ